MQVIQTLSPSTAASITAASVLLEESVQIGEQVSIPWAAHTATLLGRLRYVNVSDGRHYFPLGLGSMVSGRQLVRPR